MRISELLNAMASWLESPDNEAVLLAEYDEQSLQVVAEHCVLAAALLKKAAEEVEDIEPAEPSHITPESIQGLANLATALDSSQDPEFKKQASVIDELILSIAAPKDALSQKKAADEKKIDEIRKKYQDPEAQLMKDNKIADSQKAIEKSKMTDKVHLNEQPLSTRTCPDHPGAQLGRVGEHMFQCNLDHKIYNYEAGYTLENGEKVPGGDVSLQTSFQILNAPSHSIFDTRQERLLTNKA